MTTKPRRARSAGKRRPVGKGRRVAHDRQLERFLARARRRLTRLRPLEAEAAIRKGAFLIDIRPEFQRRADGEIPGAIVVERNHLEWRLHPASNARIAEARDANVHWIVICDEGYASSLAAASLQSIGLRGATDVAGGFRAWQAAGLPIGSPGVVTPPRLAARDSGAES